MPKQPSITILLPEAEKTILETFCSLTERNQTDVIRAFIRSLVDELPFHYGIGGWGGTPLKIWLRDGRKLTEEELLAEMPEAYSYWKQAYANAAKRSEEFQAKALAKL
jgi:hypothetical protein